MDQRDHLDPQQPSRSWTISYSFVRSGYTHVKKGSGCWERNHERSSKTIEDDVWAPGPEFITVVSYCLSRDDAVLQGIHFNITRKVEWSTYESYRIACLVFVRKPFACHDTTFFWLVRRILNSYNSWSCDRGEWRELQCHIGFHYHLLNSPVLLRLLE